QQIALLCQLLLKRWKQLFGLCERRVLRKHVRLCRLTEAELTLEDIEKVTLDRDNALGRRDLATKRRLLNRGGHDVAGQREIGGLELKELLFRDRVKAL